MITFKANYVAPVTVQKLNNTEYQDHKVSLVEFDTNSKNDELVLNGLHKEWGSKDYYSQDVYYSYMHKKNNSEKHVKRRFFALTNQQKDFDKLNSNDILGVCQISKGLSNSNQINFIQVKPKHMASCFVREMKNIGTQLLKSMEKIMNKENIVLYANNATRKFYEKNGYSWQNAYGKMIIKP